MPRQGIQQSSGACRQYTSERFVMSDLLDELSERAAAEDYRRQRQEASARKSGFVPMRPDELQQLTDFDAVLRRIRLIPGITGSETSLQLATPRTTRARLA